MRTILSQHERFVEVKKHQAATRSHSRASIFPVGEFFLSYHRDGIVRWQGRVLAELTPGRYRIQLYSWITGEPTDRLDVSARSMRGWTFYDTAKAWHADIQHKTGARPLDADADSYLFVLGPSTQTPTSAGGA